MKILKPKKPLDLTGVHPNNKVRNEPHTLSNKSWRAIIPAEGLFYRRSMVVRDKYRILVPDEDYKFEGLHSDLTVRTGKEVSAAILIGNPEVTGDLILEYQCVGDIYGLDNQAIYGAYESILRDTRNVDWIDIENKPHFYNPTAHKHFLKDVYGFEPVVYAIERINQSINGGMIDILVNSVNMLLDRFTCGELDKILPTAKLMQHDAVLYLLTSKKLLSDISVKVVDCFWKQGRTGRVVIDTTDIEPGKKLYWSFYKEGRAEIFLPVALNGVTESNGGLVYVDVYIPAPHIHNKERLYFGVTTKFQSDEFEAVTYKLDIRPAIPLDTTYGIMAGHKRWVDSDEMCKPFVHAYDRLSQAIYAVTNSSMFSGIH